ncbi:putative flavin carrier protein 2-2 [Coleophoma cylindrospora]|uniref:Putative flavin carrier protein 2-2 n=1 Tax=Coleophoma cylindrospora TaxID=1849047 RepID=A0A3D8QJL3_9HELO|nr:putative flavin carrier protein 2-2 [Coleophoma cylindrospora]
MRPACFSSLLVSAGLLLSVLAPAAAIHLIESKSLNTCQDNSSFSASLFNVVYTPDNGTLSFDVVAFSSIQGNVMFDVEAVAYGYTILKKTLDPCTIKELSGVCPMSTGQIDINSNIVLGKNAVTLPGIAYGVPDLDAYVKVLINETSNPGVSVACVEAHLSNGQTVDQKGVGWSTAVISGMALVASAVTSGKGHSNTAAHVAASALSLFGYFQAQAIVGLTAVPLPPIVQSWTENFDWTIGIMQVDFMQTIATWYQKSTGGTPSTLLNTLTTTSVEVLKKRDESFNPITKRSIDTSIKLLTRAHQMTKRTSDSSVSGIYTVKGIKRVAFRANIEATNLFLTSLIFFCIFIVVTGILVAMFKGICELAARGKTTTKFRDFRNGWTVVLKGILFRIVLISYPQMTIFCLWEFTQVDSPAEVVLAVFFFVGMTGTLIWAAMQVIRTAKRSVTLHKSPAYILYSDPATLNKWGFLYVQFRATAYYFILVVLVYTVIKGIFIAFGQNSGTLQAIALVVIEGIALIGASVLRPWMDKSTNTFNILICAVNFVNAIFLLAFTDVFDQPGIVTGVMGVIFFIYNAVFSLILIILVLVATIYAFLRKNPDSRYQPVADDRGSFIKSKTQLTTELDALGATARGEYKHNFDLDHENKSWSSDDIRNSPANIPIPPSTANSQTTPRGSAHPPVDPSAPFFQAGSHESPPGYPDSPRRIYQGHPDSRPNSNLPLIMHDRDSTPSPASFRGNSSTTHLAGYRRQDNASPVGFNSPKNSK